jgi:hypothetical protein
MIAQDELRVEVLFIHSGVTGSLSGQSQTITNPGMEKEFVNIRLFTWFL